MRLTHLFALTLSLLILPAEAARELSWDDLVPAGTGHLYGMPPAQHNGLQSEDQAPANPLTQSMANAPTVAELDGQEVKLPGYVVPLNVDPNQRVTEFLLVPYFGACIHEPAPPPNQTIYAEFEPGYMLESLWDPFWIEGTLLTTRVEEELATASYTMRADKIEPFIY